MATTATEAPSAGRPVTAMSWGEDLTTVLLGLWLMAGIAIDGWAHTNLSQIETFFTPWHAIFYSGFAATAAWVLWSARRRRELGRPLVEAVPAGYELGVAGVLVFALGGVGDMIWHTVFGIEVNVDALLSPTHLLLYLGVILIVTSPMRAAWGRSESALGLKAFLPVLLSAALVAGFTSFMFLYLSPFLDIDMSFDAGRFPTDEYLHFLNQRSGIASILITTVILYSTALLLIRRWRTPMFTFTAIFAIAAAVVQGVGNFTHVYLIGAAALGGLGADLLAHFLQPSAGRTARLRIFAGVAPPLLWILYVAAVAAFDGLGWQIELWAGAIVWSGIIGLGLSLLIMPPALPADV